MAELPTIEERVALGVSRLDEDYPGWALLDRVDPDTLDLANDAACTLGQVYGSFSEGIIGLDLEEGGWEYGFDLWEYSRPAVLREVAALTAEWQRVIRERRAEQ